MVRPHRQRRRPAKRKAICSIEEQTNDLLDRAGFHEPYDLRKDHFFRSPRRPQNPEPLQQTADRRRGGRRFVERGASSGMCGESGQPEIEVRYRHGGMMWRDPVDPKSRSHRVFFFGPEDEVEDLLFRVWTVQHNLGEWLRQRRPRAPEHRIQKDVDISVEFLLQASPWVEERGHSSDGGSGTTRLYERMERMQRLGRRGVRRDRRPALAATRAAYHVSPRKWRRIQAQLRRFFRSELYRREKAERVYYGALTSLDISYSLDVGNPEAQISRGDSRWLRVHGDKEEHHRALNKGINLAADGFLPDGVKELRRAIALDPDFPEPHLYLAAVHLIRNDDTAAATELRLYRDLRRRLPDSAKNLWSREDAPASIQSVMSSRRKRPIETDPAR